MTKKHMLEVEQKIPIDTWGEDVVVDAFLNEGSQGEVYQVKYKEKRYALKIYKPKIPGKNKMYNILHENVKHSPPNRTFLWPLAMTRKITIDGEETFGYLMELFDTNEYKTLFELRHQIATFASFKIMIEAAYQILASFHRLHLLGYSFMDVSNKNILVNPQTGEVRVCDCDNCVASTLKSDEKPEVYGTPEFMAPEILEGKGKPNRASDLFSIAIILYEMFYIDYPFEGEFTLKYPLNDMNRVAMYGEVAQFHLNPEPNPNRLVPGRTDSAIRLQNHYPPDMKMLFLRAFNEGKNPRKRVNEKQFIEMLIRVYGQLLKAENGERFVNIYNPARLPANTYIARNSSGQYFVLGGYSTICRAQLGDSWNYGAPEWERKADPFLEEIAIVGVSQDKKYLSLKNISSDTWKVYKRENGEWVKTRELKQNEHTILDHRMKIAIVGTEKTIEIL